MVAPCAPRSAAQHTQADEKNTRVNAQRFTLKMLNVK
jgi:hypothetical protein